MDRYTAAALGQNISSAFSEIGQMFDPRLRAAAEQQRLTNEGLGLRNQGLGISNQYAPKVYDSQIAQNYASANSSNAAAGNYNASAAFTNARTEGLERLGAMTSGGSPKPLSELQSQVAATAERYGIPAQHALAIVQQESGFNPNTKAGTSSASGLFQFLDADRQKYGIDANSPMDLQIEAGIRKMKENYDVTRNALGREPTAGELYTTYYQGIGAGPEILKNPDASFYGTLSNPRFGGSGYADRVIKANPWLANIKTNRDFVNWSEGKMKSKGFAPTQSAFNPRDAAIHAAVANGGGNPSQLVDAFAKVKGMNATDELTARQSLTGQGKFAGQGEYFDPSMSDAYQNRGLENNRVIADNNARMNLVGDLLKPAGAPRRGDGSMPDVIGAPKTFNDMQKVNEEAQATSFRAFGVPLNEEGAPTEDSFAPTRRVWAESFANARRAGMSQIEAEAAANLHHFGTDQPEIISEDSWFGEPSLPEIKNTEPLQRPQQSQVFSAQNQEQLAPIVAAILGLPVQTPAISNSGAPVTGVDNSNQQPNNAGQKPSGQQTIRRYNPATGAIE